MTNNVREPMENETAEQPQKPFPSPSEKPEVPIKNFAEQQRQDHDGLLTRYLAGEIDRDQFNELVSKPVVELEKARRALERQTAFDPMTGLYRKELLANLLANRVREMARLRREKDAPKPRATILLLDLDRFSRVNNEFSYAVGDQAISTLGVILRGQLRPGDLAGRFGGEEFFILLENTKLEAGLKAAERYREAISDNFSLFVPEIGPQTASIGVMELPDEVFGKNFTEEDAARDLLLDLVRMVQEPLKIGGKEAGRNRIGVRRFNPETHSYDIFTASFSKDQSGRVVNIQYTLPKI